MTSRTLFDICYRAAIKLGESWESIATGGTTTSVVDAKFLTQGDNYWGGDGENMGTVFIVKTADGLAPQGEFGRVTASDQGDTNVTIDALSVLVEAGDRYCIVGALFPLHMLIQKANQAIQEIGDKVSIDTSITTASSTSEYTLPDTNIDVRRVEIQTVTDTASQNGWRVVQNWHIEKTATGSADQLVFDLPPASSRTLRITYTQFHPTIHAATDVLDENYPLEVVVLRTAVLCLQQFSLEQQQTGPGLNAKIKLLQVELSRMVVARPYRVPYHTRRRLVIGGYG